MINTSSILNDCKKTEFIINAIRNIGGPGVLPLHEPEFNGNEKKYIFECIESTFVSSVGKYVEEFESNISNFTKSKYVIAVNNGTSALHMSLLTANIKKNDEVLIPSLTFVATANSVTYCGAIPHFIDCNENSLSIDPIILKERLKEIVIKENGFSINKKTRRVIKAIIPVHIFGHPAEMEEIIKIAADYNLTIIEDAAESLGSYYQGKHTGTFGLLGAISFNGNKIITTGGGGVILTDNKDLAAKLKHITTTAKLKHPWNSVHDQIGYNYRMPNINAALGCAQLERINFFLSKKRKLYDLYKKKFHDQNWLKLLKEQDKSKSNYWLQTIILNKPDRKLLNNILSHSNSEGVVTRPVWKLISELEPYKNCPKSELDNSMSLENRIINIPSGVNLVK